jgi:proteasome assembly chaperone 3
MATNALIGDQLSMPAVDVKEEAFPAPSKHVTGSVDGVPTEVTSMSFSDKIIVTLSQEGRLSQWVCLPYPIIHMASGADRTPRSKFPSQLHHQP